MKPSELTETFKEFIEILSKDEDAKNHFESICAYADEPELEAVDKLSMNHHFDQLINRLKNIHKR